MGRRQGNRHFTYGMLRGVAPAVAALYVATMALVCSAVVALEVPALILAMVLGLETVIVTVSPGRRVPLLGDWLMTEPLGTVVE